MSAMNKLKNKKIRRAVREEHKRVSRKEFPPLFRSVPKAIIKGQKYLAAIGLPHHEKIASLPVKAISSAS